MPRTQTIVGSLTAGLRRRSKITQVSGSEKHAAVAAVEVPPKPLVVLQPPHSGAREDDVLGARRALRLEPGDRLPAVGRVVAGVGAVVAAREMPRPATVHAQQLVVAAADDEHGGVGGDRVDHRPPHPLGQLSVPIAVAAPVGLPRFLPLVLEPGPIRLQHAGVLAARHQLAERGLAEVMDEGVVGAEQPVAGRRAPAASSRRPRAARSRSARRAARPARRAPGASRRRTSSGSGSRTPHRHALARARRRSERARPRSGSRCRSGPRCRSGSWSGRPSRPAGRSRCAASRPSQPGLTAVSSLSSTSISPAASAAPWLQAAANPRFESLQIGRTFGLRSASRARYAGVPSLEPLSTTISSTGALGAGEHALEAEPEEGEVVAGDDDHARLGSLGGAPPGRRAPSDRGSSAASSPRAASVAGRRASARGRPGTGARADAARRRGGHASAPRPASAGSDRRPSSSRSGRSPRSAPRVPASAARASVLESATPPRAPSPLAVVLGQPPSAPRSSRQRPCLRRARRSSSLGR